MTYKDNGHDDDTIMEWSKEDKEEITHFRADLNGLKARLNFWVLKGEMEIVSAIAELIMMYDEQINLLIDKYKDNYGVNKSKSNIDFFSRN